MNAIDLTFSEETSKLPIGASKFLGNPDVWDGFEWPQFIENGESYDLTFMCQINCAEASPFDKEGTLPKIGLLYFFYDLDEMPLESFDKNAARVLYYGGGPAALHEMLRIDHEGNDMSLREMKIQYHSDGVERERLGARLGESLPQRWQPIFQVFSFETDMVSIKFPDEKALCFFIDKAKLERGDFSDVRIRQTDATDKDHHISKEAHNHGRREDHA